MECSSSRRSHTLIDLTQGDDSDYSIKSIISTIDLTQDDTITNDILLPTQDDDEVVDHSRMLSYLRDCEERLFEYADSSVESNNEKTNDVEYDSDDELDESNDNGKEDEDEAESDKVESEDEKSGDEKSKQEMAYASNDDTDTDENDEKDDEEKEIGENSNKSN